MRKDAVEWMRAVGEARPASGLESMSRAQGPPLGRSARRRVLACLLAALALGGLLAGCGSSGSGSTSSPAAGSAASTPGGNPQRGGTLNVVTPLPFPSLDSYTPGASPASGVVNSFIVENLVAPVPGTTKLVPALAESWKVADGDQAYTFRIRSNVKFSNGDPLTLKDYVYSVKLWADSMRRNGDSCCQNITRVFAPTSDSVRIEFSRPQPTLLQDLAWDPIAGIVDSTYREQVGASAFARKPIGTGPFKVAEFRSGDATLVRNTYYRKPGHPYLDGVHVRSITNANTRILSVRTGEAQIATGLPFSQARSLEKATDVRLLVQDPWAAVYVLFMNSDRGPLSEKAVRRALSYATDRETIIKTALYGFGRLANSVAAPFGAYDPTVKPVPYDVALARDELAKSSTPDGFSLELMVQSGDNTGDITAAILQDAYAKIGVRTSVRKVEPATYISDFVAGKYQMAIGPFDWWPAIIGEPDPQMGGLYANEANHHVYTWHRDPETSALVRRMLTSTDSAERRDLASRVQQRSLADPPIIPVAFLNNATLVGKNVCDFHMMPVNRYLGNAADVYLSPEC